MGLILYFPNVSEWVQEFASSASCHAAAESVEAAALAVFLRLRMDARLLL